VQWPSYRCSDSVRGGLICSARLRKPASLVNCAGCVIDGGTLLDCWAGSGSLRVYGNEISFHLFQKKKKFARLFHGGVLIAILEPDFSASWEISVVFEYSVIAHVFSSCRLRLVEWVSGRCTVDVCFCHQCARAGLLPISVTLISFLLI